MADMYNGRIWDLDPEPEEKTMYYRSISVLKDMGYKLDES